MCKYLELRLIFLNLGLLFFITSTFAVLPAPPLYAVDSITNNYLDVQALGTLVPLSAGVEFYELDLPFSFQFYDSYYSSIWISTNCFISFANDTAYRAPRTIPSVSANNNGGIITSWWIGSSTGSNSKIAHYLTGIVGARVFFLQWYKFIVGGSSQVISIIIKLYESNHRIEIHHSIDTPTLNFASPYTIGIEAPGGLEGVQYYYGNIPVPNTTAIRFFDVRDSLYSTLVSSIAYSWEDASAGTLLSTCNDCDIGPLNLNFAYNFFDTSTTSIILNSNGYITLSNQGLLPDTAMYTPVAHPNTSLPNNMISIFWGNLYPVGTGGKVYTAIVGTAPYRHFIIEFSNAVFFGSTNVSTFEIKLYESRSYAEILLNSTSSDGAKYHVTGFEDSTGRIGHTILDSTGDSQSSVAWRIFTPIHSSWLVWDCNDNGIFDYSESSVTGLYPQLDCNNNSVSDWCDTNPFHAGKSLDCNDDHIPDECQLVGDDCNANGIPDICELNATTDCNNNTILDTCELNTTTDCDLDGILDECELIDVDYNDSRSSNLNHRDCQPNGIIDICDITKGNSSDCNHNHIPDECDVNENGVFPGGSVDCNEDGIPDECEYNQYTDCNNNSILDTCEFAEARAAGTLNLIDCNGNGILDVCDMKISFGKPPADPDCNNNSIPDSCDIKSDPIFYHDCDSNGIIDTCQIGTPPECCNDVTDRCVVQCDDNPDNVQSCNCSRGIGIFIACFPITISSTDIIINNNSSSSEFPVALVAGIVGGVGFCLLLLLILIIIIIIVAIKYRQNSKSKLKAKELGAQLQQDRREFAEHNTEIAAKALGGDDGL